MYMNFSIVFDFVLNNIGDNNDTIIFLFHYMSIIFVNVIKIVMIITCKSNRNVLHLFSKFGKMGKGGCIYWNIKTIHI